MNTELQRLITQLQKSATQEYLREQMNTLILKYNYDPNDFEITIGDAPSKGE